MRARASRISEQFSFVRCRSHERFIENDEILLGSDRILRRRAHRRSITLDI